MKKSLLRYLVLFIGGLAAGNMIGIGVTVYLSLLPSSKIFGAFLFGFGLYGIFNFGGFLYTGKVGLTLDNKPIYLLDLLFGLIGNFVGIFCFCSLMKLTRYGASLQETALTLVNAKQNDSWYSIFILSCFCGFMIYFAVLGNRLCTHPLNKALTCFLSVIIFIFSGFEHCIANAGYYTYAGVFSWKALLYFLLMILGNGIGAIFLDALHKIYVQLKNKAENVKDESDYKSN